MIIELFLIISIGFFVCLLMGLYFYFKCSKALLNLQQSGYDNARMFRYIKTHYKYTFGVNELLLFIGIYVYSFNRVLGLFLMAFFLYYNLRFFNISSIRFVKKLSLKITMRVRRIIFVFIILNSVVIYSLVFFQVNYFIIPIIITYLIYPLLLSANFILIPIEKKIKNGFKKKTKKKIDAYNDLFVIGITGSYGKTSIKNIVGTILDDFEPTLITPESYNTPMGLTITINEYLNTFHKNFVAEMGAYYEGEIKELTDLVSPKVGIVSSIGNQHLETFKSIDTIQRTKMELIEALPSDGLGVLNYDNKHIRSYKIKNDVQVRYYSLEDKGADIYGFDIKYLDAMMQFSILFKGKTYTVKTKLLGSHNIENILAAILVADYKGFNIDKVIKAIGRIKPVKNRLEYKYINPKLSIIDDAFNANTSGIKEAIKILGTYENKRRIIITPGLIDLGNESKSFHIELGQYLTNYVDDVILIGTLNQNDIIKGIEKTNFDINKVHCYDNFLEGYNYAISQTEEKIVLIANDLPDKFND